MLTFRSDPDARALVLPDDVPRWMRPRRRTIDWALIIVCVIGLLAAWGFVAWPGIARHTDAPLFAARSVEVAEALRAGTLYTRWAADFNFGLGSPLFNYLAPIPHLLSGIHQLVTDANPIDSIKILLGFSIVSAGIGMYYLLRGRYGTSAALIGALAYLCSPPIAFVLPYQTGDLASALSLALLPWACWSLDRIGRTPTRGVFTIAAFTIAAWSLADTRLTLLGAPIIGVFVLVSPKRTLALWVVGIAALLTAFFWLPALAERGAVTWLPLATDARAGVITPAEQLAVPPFVDPNVLNAPIDRGLGIGFLSVAALGTLAVYWRGRHDRIAPELIAFLVLGGGALIMAALAPELPLTLTDGWQPLLPFYWVIGLALPCLSIIAAQSARWLEGIAVRPQSWALTALCVPVLLTVLPALASIGWKADARLDAALSPPDETALHAIGSLRTGLLWPTTAHRPNTSAEESILNHAPIALPNMAHILDRSPLVTHFAVNVNAALRVSFDRLAFPGWSITVDGTLFSAEPDVQGLVSIGLIPSARQVSISFDSTDLRTMSWLLPVCGFLLILWRVRGLRDTPPSDSGSFSFAPLTTLTRPSIAPLIMMLGICLVGGVALHLMVASAPIDPSAVPLGRIPEAHIALMRYQVAPSGEIEVFWKAEGAPPLNYQLEARLVRESDGRAAANFQEWQPGGIPTTQWLPNDTVRDVLRFDRIPTDGAYHVEIALAQCAKPQNLPCADAARLPVSQAGQPASAEWLRLALPN